MISDGRGTLVHVDMDTVDTATGLDCNKVFGEFLQILGARQGVKILTFTNMWGYN